MGRVRWGAGGMRVSERGRSLLLSLLVNVVIKIEKRLVASASQVAQPGITLNTSYSRTITLSLSLTPPQVKRMATTDARQRRQWTSAASDRSTEELLVQLRHGENGLLELIDPLEGELGVLGRDARRDRSQTTHDKVAKKAIQRKDRRPQTLVRGVPLVARVRYHVHTVGKLEAGYHKTLNRQRDGARRKGFQLAVHDLEAARGRAPSGRNTNHSRSRRLIVLEGLLTAALPAPSCGTSSPASTTLSLNTNTQRA